MVNAKCETRSVVAVLLHMSGSILRPYDKPYDIHERLFLFACDIVKTAQFLQQQGPIGEAVSYQILAAGVSTGANAQEGEERRAQTTSLRKCESR